MLTGDLVRVKTAKQRVMPLYIDRNAPQHGLRRPRVFLLLFRERDRHDARYGEIESEIDELFGADG